MIFAIIKIKRMININLKLFEMMRNKEISQNKIILKVIYPLEVISAVNR